MITSWTPTDWRDLQEQVAAILRECGFAAEVEKSVPNVRGSKKVDVYAEETVRGRKYIILCECKHWGAAVPQDVIHGFRTIVSDTGANVGYVIAPSGFQSGAFAASELTNLQLVTWEEFQATFEESWLEYFSKSLTERLDPLLTYCEPLLPRWFDGLPDHEQDEYMALKERHDALGYLVMEMTTYLRIFSKGPLPLPPLRSHYADKPEFLAALPADLLDIRGYRELHAALVRHGDAAIVEFRAIRARNAVATRAEDCHE